MGKIGSSSGEVDIEVIPVEAQRSQSRNPDLYLVDNPIRMQRFPYQADPTIVPRVQKYLEANVHKSFIDINQMADELQRTYREYGKRKRSAFRGAVKKAYSIVMKNYSVPINQQTSSEEDLSEESTDDLHFRNSRMGKQFGPSPQEHPLIAQQGELIDISSDDAEDIPPPATQITKISNLPTKHPLLPLPHISLKPLPEKNENNDTVSPQLGKKRKLENYTPTPAVVKKKKTVNAASFEVPNVNFYNVNGLDSTLEQISDMLMHLKHPSLCDEEIPPTKGLLLYGPPGCGKTLIAHAIAGQFDVPLLKVAATDLVGGISGESEERIRDLFDKAIQAAPCIILLEEIDAIAGKRENASKEMEKRIVTQLVLSMDDIPYDKSVVIIGTTNRQDDIDAALRRPGRFDEEVHIGIPDTQQRLQIIKQYSKCCKLADDVDLDVIARNTPGYVGADVKVLFKTARRKAFKRLKSELIEIKKLEQAVLLHNQKEKFNKQAEKSVEEEVDDDDDDDKREPEIIVDGDSKDKEDLKVDNEEQNGNSSNTVVVIDDDVKQPEDKPEVEINNTEAKEDIPEKLQEIVSKSKKDEIINMISFPLTEEQLENLTITMEDIQDAISNTKPTIKREGFATVPDVTWADVGSLSSIREVLQMEILVPANYPHLYYKTKKPSGILLCGPPGCGKTLVAKAIANESGINFLSVSGPELLSKYVGESEKQIRITFDRARSSAPCVIFFDEIDALCSRRSADHSGDVNQRVVNQLLTEMDGVRERKNVFILAATNRPDVIDPALLRPGRFSKTIYIGLPSADDRADILRTITKNGTEPALSADIDLQSIGKSDKCQGFTGADLYNLINEAYNEGMRDIIKTGLQKPVLLTNEHFHRAFKTVRPSVLEKDQKHYDKFKKLYSLEREFKNEDEMDCS